ncbi:Endonuclease/exonuclease/phosphatase [Lipomyces kononenkoae]
MTEPMGKKQEDKKRKGGGRPDYVTPEYIAAQRAKREQAKAEKARRNQELGIVDPAAAAAADGFNTNFIKRPMLAICQEEEDDEDGVDVKIMTYNVLGQALIRRELFPTNGDALKWRWRSKMLLSELKYYGADIMCLQEVDLVHMDSFYDPELRALGYDYVYVRGEGKNHGLVISWRKSVCKLVRSESIVYDDDNGYDDDDDDGDVDDLRPTMPQTRTRNVGCLAALQLHAGGGLVVGTTHLFWHPHGTFERTRQAAILVRRAKKFSAGIKWPVFLAGDFNSQPIDSPYLCLTQPRSTRHTAHSYAVLCRSREHEYGKGAEDEHESTDCPEASVDASDDAAGGIMAGSGSRTRTTIEEVERLHDNNGVLLQSVYGAFYRRVHPANASETDSGEPGFSNWAFTWRGLLDYIFVMDFNANANANDKETRAGGEIVPGVRVKALLRLPEAKEMGAEPSGQPREGQYPSDHLCLMAGLRVRADIDRANK